MHKDNKNVLLISMPYAGIDIPSIQLATLESYLKQRNINIKTRHLYLKAAEFYKINNYNTLIHPPNDSYTAQMVFSKFVFPEHWKKNIKKFREYYNKLKFKNIQNKKHFSFDQYVQCTDNFYDWIFTEINWDEYDIIGFTLNYGQFLPSLAVAKKIKDQYPDKKIIFGGSRTTGELGKKVLESFPYIDFIASAEGEETLYRLVKDIQNYESIPNLIYRKQNKIICNQSEEIINLNQLPTPLFDSFFEEMTSLSPEIYQFFSYCGKLPIEISRGCWWNKCTFCNLNIQHKYYREKNVEKIIEEIDYLSNKYKMLNFQIISNNLLIKNQLDLCKKIIKLGKDLTFFAEARAGQLKSKDYTLLKEAGFITIQTGIESFSKNYLIKINKGTRIIDNIAALKFCKENNIINQYNLIIDYPNEESIDFEETKKTINRFRQYLEPPQICYLRVAYGSPIHCNPEQFNIDFMDYAPIDKIMFPLKFLKKKISFVYTYKTKKEKESFEWKKLINKWKIEREMLEIDGIKSQNITDQLIFYYVDGGDFIKIYDKRNFNNIQIFTLNNLEREIFLSCIDVVSLKELKDRISRISEEELMQILKDFENNNIIFREEEYYLSLPLSYKIMNHTGNDKTFFEDLDSKYLEKIV